MVRIFNNSNQLTIKITNTKYIGKKDWNFLVNTCNTFYSKQCAPLIIELDNNIIISPLIKRAFNLFYSNYKNTLVIIK